MQHRNGLYQKYEVYRSKGSDKVSPGKRVDGCFVLRPRTDPIAAEALAAYALATPDDELRDDLFGWLWVIRNVTES